MTDCAICIEPFNKTRRKPVVCPYCPADTAVIACTTCVKTYLLQDDVQMPRCAACNSGWTEDFLSQTFPKTWLLKEYKAHRERVLLDTERARLPEAQEDAARYRQAIQIIQAVDVQTAPILEQMGAIPEAQQERDAEMEYTRLARERRRLELTHHRLQDATEEAVTAAVAEQDAAREAARAAWRTLREVCDRHRAARVPFQEQLRQIRGRNYAQALTMRSRVGKARIPRTQQEGDQGSRSQWTFLMKCPLAVCEGFVGTDWKCGLCAVEFCKECGEAQAEEHACDPDTKATFQAMRKEAKPCPKCACMISKIDGCDQMWCTQCQTAFSWRTGQIERLHVHNPHYFQWLRQTGGEAPTRPVGDCLNLTPDELMQQVVHYARRRQQWVILEWVRILRHIQFIHRHLQQTLRAKQDDEWRRQLRVKRLVNEITDEIWKDRLQRGEKAAQKHYAVIQILELFIQVGMDTLRNCLPDDADIPVHLRQLEEVRVYCNQQMELIKKRYNNEVVYIESVDERAGRNALPAPYNRAIYIPFNRAPEQIHEDFQEALQRLMEEQGEEGRQLNEDNEEALEFFRTQAEAEVLTE